MNDGQERYEASLFDDDHGHDDRDHDGAEPPHRQVYRCSDMMCGALDCTRCNPDCAKEE